MPGASPSASSSAMATATALGHRPHLGAPCRRKIEKLYKQRVSERNHAVRGAPSHSSSSAAMRARAQTDATSGGNGPRLGKQPAPPPRALKRHADAPWRGIREKRFTR